MGQYNKAPCRDSGWLTTYHRTVPNIVGLGDMFEVAGGACFQMSSFTFTVCLHKIIMAMVLCGGGMSQGTEERHWQDAGGVLAQAHSCHSATEHTQRWQLALPVTSK